MPRAAAIQGNFNAGEFSPLMQGRVDAPQYKQGLATCLNYLPAIQGGLYRRPGTHYVHEAKFSSKFTRLEAFEFSTTQTYMLEFGDLYIRFFSNGGLVTYSPILINGVTNASPGVVVVTSHGFGNGDRIIISGISSMPRLDNKEFIVANVTTNTFTLLDSQTSANIDTTNLGTFAVGGTVAKIFEMVTVYPHTDVFNLKFCQSDDVLYIAISNQPPFKLSRLGATNWTCTKVAFADGPYLDVNNTATTLTPSSTTGSVTLTASSIVGINGGTGFATTDIGRLVRLENGTTWTWAKITAFTSTTVVTATLQGTLADTSGLVNWQLGLYSATTGYPTCCTFHESRLIFGGAAAAPQRFDGSKSSDFENFAPTASDGTVAANNAIAVNLDSDDVNSLVWMNTDEKGLIGGTVGGEWFIRPASTDAGLTPTNISAKQSTNFGSINTSGLKIGRAHLFIQRTGRKVRELTYDFYVDGLDAIDLTEIAEHITGPGLVQMAYQQTPQSLVWCVRTDGVLSAMTYERGGQTVKVGWSRHILGGDSDPSGTSAFVESIGVIPTATYDQLWVVVRRWINGASHRYIEHLTRPFEAVDAPEDALFVDAAVGYDHPIVIIDAEQSNPVVVTATSHGLSNGDLVRIEGVLGMTQLNGPTFTVAGATTNTFQLLGIDGTNFGTYVPSGLGTSAGEVRKLVSTVSGLNHLEGQTVSILGDGAVLEPQVVTNGAITLSNHSGTVVIGLPYNSDAQMLRLDSGAADGTAFGKTRRTNRVGFLVYRTCGLKFGTTFDTLDEITFRTSNDPMSRATPLFSGIVSQEISADYDFDNQICWRQDGPLPGTILAVMPQLITQDRG